MLGVAEGRRLPNWIDSFLRYSDQLQSPEMFRKWAGIGIVSAVMERKVWSFTRGSKLFPNQYVIFVATPGVGKSQILSYAENMLRRVLGIHVAPSSLTTASLIDAIAIAKRNLTVPSVGVVEFNSLQAVASELGVLMPVWDPAFMNTLTKIYDGEHYEERRRTGKVNHLIIDSPLLSIIGGTTPNSLGKFLPEGAWEQGFTSRTLLIFSDEKVDKDLWEDPTDKAILKQLEEDLVHDLTAISKLYGQVTFSKECKEAIDQWRGTDLAPVPTHPKLFNYNTRRVGHLLKLCQIASVSHSNDLQITVADYLTAKGWLLEAEHLMPHVFDKMAKTVESSVAEDVKAFIKVLYIRSRRPVSQGLIVSYLRDRTPHHNILRVIDTMQQAGEITMVLEQGMPAWKPLY